LPKSPNRALGVSALAAHLSRASTLQPTAPARCGGPALRQQLARPTCAALILAWQSRPAQRRAQRTADGPRPRGSRRGASPRPGRNLGLGRESRPPPGPKAGPATPSRTTRSDGCPSFSLNQNQEPASTRQNPRPFLLSSPFLFFLRARGRGRGCHQWRGHRSCTPSAPPPAFTFISLSSPSHFSFSATERQPPFMAVGGRRKM
jgi:hypothetical protein